MFNTWHLEDFTRRIMYMTFRSLISWSLTTASSLSATSATPRSQGSITTSPLWSASDEEHFLLQEVSRELPETPGGRAHWQNHWHFPGSVTNVITNHGVNTYTWCANDVMTFKINRNLPLSIFELAHEPKLHICNCIFFATSFINLNLQEHES